MPPKRSNKKKTSIIKKKSPKIVENVYHVKTRSKRPAVAIKTEKESEPLPSTSADFKPRVSTLTKKKTLKDNKKAQPVPKTSAIPEPGPSSAFPKPTCSYSAKKKTSKYDSYVITPKAMKSTLNAYKLSPDWQNLKKGNFNTGFINNRPRKDPYIEIFTPEEEEQFLRENPIEDHGFTYGDKTANVFKKFPEMVNIDDVEEECAAIKAKLKAKNMLKRGRKPSLGYKGEPLPNPALSESSLKILLESDSD